MFDVGFPELVLIFIIGLLVLGPQRLPKVAAEIGKWVGRARRTATQLRRQLEREIELAELDPSSSSPPSANNIRPPAGEPKRPDEESSEAAAAPASPPPDPASTAAPTPVPEPAEDGDARRAATSGAAAGAPLGTGEQSQN